MAPTGAAGLICLAWIRGQGFTGFDGQRVRAIQAELTTHAAAREQHYRQADPGQLARSLPGFAEISAPVLIAAMGRPGRFRDGTRFKSYTGLAPRASETGQTDRKGQPMSKAGPSLLRATFFRAADTARRQDPSSPGSTTCR